jgi:hypothetical protein
MESAQLVQYFALNVTMAINASSALKVTSLIQNPECVSSAQFIVRIAIALLTAKNVLIISSQRLTGHAFLA